MSIKLPDLLDVELLDAHQRDGLVRSQAHPDLPLRIFNYTEKAQYDSVWDHVTMTCRGLIVDDETSEVLARPFAKFFNHGQPAAPPLDLSAPAVVTDKADGSLGILYPTPDGMAVATRGSFTSDQAIHATDVWRGRYADQLLLGDGWTWLFEIVYPSNRIVVDYGDTDDLILLGAVEIATGRSVPPGELRHAWPGPVVETFQHCSLADALAAAPRPNAEGLVVHLPDVDQRVKIKQDDYVALHRIVTGLNARTVWQHLVDGRALDELIAPLPDEFHGWVRDVAGELRSQVEDRHIAIEDAFLDLTGSLPEGWTRKDFAAVAVPHLERAGLFALLDGKDVLPALWRDARPEAFWTPAGRRFTEDVA